MPYHPSASVTAATRSSWRRPRAWAITTTSVSTVTPGGRYRPTTNQTRGA